MSLKTGDVWGHSILSWLSQLTTLTARSCCGFLNPSFSSPLHVAWTSVQVTVKMKGMSLQRRIHTPSSYVTAKGISSVWTGRCHVFPGTGATVWGVGLARVITYDGKVFPVPSCVLSSSGARRSQPCVGPSDTGSKCHGAGSPHTCFWKFQEGGHQDCPAGDEYVFTAVSCCFPVWELDFSSAFLLPDTAESALYLPCLPASPAYCLASGSQCGCRYPRSYFMKASPIS